MIVETSQPSQNRLQNLLGRGVQVRWEIVIYTVILLLAIFTHFHILGDRVMSHDESLHTRFSWDLYEKGLFAHTPLMHGPVLFHATALSYFIFGDNDFTSRIYPAILGVLLVMTPILFRRWLGRWGAILASIMLLISPLLLYYSRYIRHDIPSILFGVIMLYSILMYINGPEHLKGKGRWLYLFSAAMILNLGSKETSFIYVAVFTSFLILYFVVRLVQKLFNIQGKTVFYLLIMGILFGGVLSLAAYIILDIVPIQLLPNSGIPFNVLTPLEQQSVVVWFLLSILFVALSIIGCMWWAFRGGFRKLPWREAFIMLLLALLTSSALIIIEELSHTTKDPLAAEPAFRWMPMVILWGITIITLLGMAFTWLRRRNTKNSPDETSRTGFWGFLKEFPEVDILVITVTLILPWLTAIVPYFMRGTANDHLEIANSLPQFLYNIILSVPTVNSAEQAGSFVIGFLAWLPMMILSIAIGLSWDWKRWLISAGIFYAIFVFFFTTVLTNIAGLGTGMIYSLGYWLEQQGVRRGDQPQYYYLLIIMPVYEFLPIIGSVLAMFAGTTIFWKWRKTELQKAETKRKNTQELSDVQLDSDDFTILAASEDSTPMDVPRAQDIPPIGIETDAKQKHELEQPDTRLERVPFLLFFAWWGILNLVGYSLAGEKMPWLGTHLTVPLIFLTAWYFGRIFDRIDAQKLLSRGWLLLLILPIFLISLAQAIGPFLIGGTPLSGLQQAQLQETYGWLGSLLVTVICGYIVYRIARRVGWAHVRQIFAVAIFSVLALITFRAAWMASFINYDSAEEFLVYAHAAPAVKSVLNDIEEWSMRTTDGPNMKFAYDNGVSWPYSWYFRDYPNAVYVGENPNVQNMDNAMVVVVGIENRPKVEPILEDRYQLYTYIRMWWPMQEYFDLTAQRIVNALDWSGNSVDAAGIRRGMFDIWWNRDYEQYGLAANKDLSQRNWPRSDKMYVYVRNDLASQIWSYGLGDGEVINPLDSLAVNACVANWSDMSAVSVFEAGEVPLQRPLDIDIAPDGNVYVADEVTNSIHIYDPNGAYLGDMNNNIGGGFQRPNGIAIDEEGNILVADTWNYQVKQLNPDGTLQLAWGQPGEYGFAAQTEPVDGFWGPRDVDIDADGNIYVSDTGNKRIRVYRIDDGISSFVRDIASGGSAPGEIDEPGSTVIHPDGRVFVADTWNRRISVFSQEGEALNQFIIKGWYNDLGNRPYIALDAERDILYITDPDAGRVLVYDINGNCLGSFGELSETPALGNQFKTASGIAVDQDGFIYVSDASAGRVLKFAPFEIVVPAPVEDEGIIQPEDNPESVPDQEIPADQEQNEGESEDGEPDQQTVG